jgi:hypothetical protein
MIPALHAALHSDRKVTGTCERIEFFQGERLPGRAAGPDVPKFLPGERELAIKI